MKKENDFVDEGNIGYISRQHTVFCGVCGNWDREESELKSKCIKVWKKLGWKLTKDRGWLCPNCYSKLKELK